MIKRNDEFSLKELISLFIPKLWLIVIIGLLVGSALGIYSAFFKEDTYTSRATIHIVKQNSTISSGDMDVMSKVIEDYKILVNTDLFLNYVVHDIAENEDYIENGWQIDNNYVSGHMRAVGVTDDILEISVTTDDQDKSNLITSVLADVIVSKSSDLFAFEGTLTLKLLNPSTINPANSKNVARNTMIGFLGGAFVTMLAIFLYSQFDIYVRDKKRLEDTFDLPIIGLIPKYDVEGGKDNV